MKIYKCKISIFFQRSLIVFAFILKLRNNQQMFHTGSVQAKHDYLSRVILRKMYQSVVQFGDPQTHYCNFAVKNLSLAFFAIYFSIILFLFPSFYIQSGMI